MASAVGLFFAYWLKLLDNICMIPEFSIKNLKGKDVVKVCESIKGATDVSIESYILDAMEKGDVENLVNTLNLVSYLAFKTILILQAENKNLKSSMLQFKN